jgi:glucose/mannose transport system permease protein
MSVSQGMPVAADRAPIGRASQMTEWLQRALPKIVLAPSFAVVLVVVYGFIVFTGVLSFTDSKILPSFNWVGWDNYAKLWGFRNWITALRNLAIFGSLYILLCSAIGLFLAILIDQKIRIEGALRPIYLYPMALSFIVTGTAWKWALNPGLGVEKLMHDWGFADFRFDWIANADRAIYTLIIAAVWQGSGFAMAVFLAALRGVDVEIVKAAKIDGAGFVRTYWSVIMPLLRPAFLTVFIIMVALSLRTFDLMVAMTGGGPGFATDLPTNFMYQFAFGRQRLGLAAASGIMIFISVAAIMGPLIWSELRREARHER